MPSLSRKFSNWFTIVGFLFIIYSCMRDKYEAFRFSALYPYDSKLEHALVFALFSPYIYLDDKLFRAKEDIVCTQTPRILCMKEIAQNVYFASEEFPENATLIRALSINLWFVYMALTFKPAFMLLKAIKNWISELDCCKIEEE